MVYCEKCETETKKMNVATYLATLTFSIIITTVIAGVIVSFIFDTSFLVELGMLGIYIIPYLALVLYPFKLGVVYKCKNKECKEVKFERTETFICGSCDSNDDVKRKKITTKLTTIGAIILTLGIILMYIDFDLFFYITKLLIKCGLGLNIIAFIIEKLQIADVKLECKHCGKTVTASRDKVIEYNL